MSHQIDYRLLKQVTVNLTNILNEKNKLITKDVIESILLKYNINHKISQKNMPIFIQAMTHITYTDRNVCGNVDYKSVDSIIPIQKLSYERLEYLGDSIIHLSIADYLFNRYNKEYEGFMTRLRIKIENGPSLARLSRAIGINEYVLISKCIEQANGRNNVKILEDIFEAFIAALYIDSNFEICKNFIISLIEKEIDIAQLLNNDTNYKDILLRYHHRNKLPVPTYECIENICNEHDNIFKMCVKDSNHKILGIGKGNTKKRGEQIAARNALIKYGEIKINSDSDDESELTKNQMSPLILPQGLFDINDEIVYENSDCE